MPKRVNMMLDDDAAELLPRLAGSQRRQGEYLSELIRAAASGPQAGQQNDQYAAIGRQVVQLVRGVVEVVQEEQKAGS